MKADASPLIEKRPSHGKSPTVAEFTYPILMKRYYPLVKNVVRAMARHLPACADTEELESVGVTGLVAAVQRYDSSKSETFEGYASMRIRGAVLDELRRMDRMPRTARQKVRRLQAAVEELEQKLGRTPTDLELRESMGLSVKEFDRLRRSAQKVSVVSLDASADSQHDDSVNLHDAIPDRDSPSAEETLERMEMRELVASKIRCLPARQQKVLAMYYFEELRLADIAEIFGVSEARICQIHTQAVNSLTKIVRRIV